MNDVSLADLRVRCPNDWHSIEWDDPTAGDLPEICPECKDFYWVAPTLADIFSALTDAELIAELVKRGLVREWGA